MSRIEYRVCGRCDEKSSDGKGWLRLDPEERVAQLIEIDLCDVCRKAFVVWMQMHAKCREGKLCRTKN